MKLQEATFMYIVNQLTTKDEREELLKTFKALDVNGDGVLSKEELIDGIYTIKIINRLQEDNGSSRGRRRSHKDYVCC